ncbi:hypothetical protein HZ994_07460 [Akkermansiaceae bacterium]|nr:hypothetical protein HZ994_07460 [Akkermansiaceae bacterium]
MRIHLVTYATPRFRHRQILLAASARINGVVDTVTSWTQKKLLGAGFEDRCKGISLTERGSGFWAWKPFIIAEKLREVPQGDIVFYCDVGRLYPFKLLDQPITPFIRWMEEQGQDLMPGVYIPWDGLNSVWTKREAFVATEMDRPEAHGAIPIQASFSIWRAGSKSQEIAAHWLDLCSQRPLISDDPSREGLMELPGFRAHRHDQALLTLCCLREKIVGLSVGTEPLSIDSRHPSEVTRHSFGEAPGKQGITGLMLRSSVRVIGQLEKSIRRRFKFGKVIQE